MNDFFLLLLLAVIGSVASLAGGLLLLWRRWSSERVTHLLLSFAAGALLGTAFFDLLPEALEAGPEVPIFAWALIGLLIFFLVERSIHWFHHHRAHEGEASNRSLVPLVMVGDTMHNFIDGLAIGAAFVADPRLGVVTALATAAHEIPQEIGDFSIMLSQKVAPKRIIFLNLISALATILAAGIVYALGDVVTPFLPALLAVTAGFFIYIAASDLIPEIHRNEAKRFALAETLLLLAGCAVIWLAVKLLD